MNSTPSTDAVASDRSPTPETPSGVPADVATHHNIERTLIAYARLVDAYEPELIAELFTESCWVDYGPGSPTDGPMRTRTEVAERLRHGLSIFTATSHHVSNVQVWVDGANRATAVSYLYAWHRFADERPEAEIWGQYHDRLERQDSRWLINHRVLHVAGERHFPIQFHRTFRNSSTK